jgi:threonine dehydratase
VIAVEPGGAASFQAARCVGAPVTFRVEPTTADGLAVSRVGALTFAIAGPLVDEAVTVTENEIKTAIALLARRCGIVAEGAGATAVAAVLAGKVRARSAVLPIGGRNIEPRLHAAIVAAQPGIGAVRPVARAA